MDNNYIDEMVRDSIGEYEMAFNPADWDVMEEELERDTRVRKKLYATKAIEACLLLVTVWTIMQFVEIDNSANYQPTLIEHREAVSPPVDEEQEVVPFKSNEKQENNSSSKPVLPQNEINPLLRNVPIANNALKTFETTTIESEKNRIIPINDYKESKNIDFKKIIDANNIIPIASLTPKMFDVNNKVFLKPIDLGLEQEDGRKKQRGNKYRVGTNLGNNVFTRVASNSFERNSLSNNRDQYSLDNSQMFNVTGGVTIDRKLTEKLKVETGVILAYQKDKVTNNITTNFVASGIDVSESIVNTSSIEIPINVLYDICSNEKNAVYALGGLSNYLRLSVEKEYDYSQSNLVYSIDPVLVDNTSEKIEGLLVTKEMPDNHYGSVNVGAGYERKLNKRLSLFAQATFKRSFGKIGFDQNDITTVSLSTGVKSIL